MRFVKVASLLLISALALAVTGCNTANTRRDMYSPKRGSGYWTDRYEKQRKQEGIAGYSNSFHRGEPGNRTDTQQPVRQ